MNCSQGAGSLGYIDKRAPDTIYAENARHLILCNGECLEQIDFQAKTLNFFQCLNVTL